MKLLTKAIETAAKAQYKKGSSFKQKIVAKFFDPCGSWTWYLMNMDPEDGDYCWGIVDGFAIEAGSFSLSELQSYKGPLGIGIERDKFFTPIMAEDLWKKLNK